MKLYLFDTINRYKRYSEMLDVKTKICNRPWIVFNDGGEKEVYKFKEDGSINIVLSGRVTRGTWEYDPTDKTIIISASDQSYMVHPGMYDDMLLALQVDGTNECSFLIEENNSQSFAPKTYSELMLFFEEKEKKEIDNEKRIRLLKEEEEKARKKEAEEAEVKRLLEERQRKIKEKEHNKIIAEFELFLRRKNYKKHSFVYELIFHLGLGLLLSVATLAFLVGVYYLFEVFLQIKNGSVRLIAGLSAVAFLVIGGKYFEKITTNRDSTFYNLLDEFTSQPQYRDKMDDILYDKLLKYK